MFAIILCLPFLTLHVASLGLGEVKIAGSRGYCTGAVEKEFIHSKLLSSTTIKDATPK